jgi:predicted nucleotidyltransferase component of viral defense system
VLKSGITEDFYLAGGTALTIKYNHRFSEDFDFFSYPDRVLDFFTLKNRVDSLNINLEWKMLTKNTMIFFICVDNNCVKFSFFEYRYPLIDKTDFNEKLKIHLASDKDIAGMKMVAIAQRGSKKDFFDLWFLIKKNGWTMLELEEIVKQKYKNLEFGIILKSFTYFEDAENENYQEIDPYWKDIKNFFLNMVKDVKIK